MKISVGSKPRASLVLSVNCLPIINGIRPFARTSSRITGVFSSNVDKTSPLSASKIFPLNGSNMISCPIFNLDTSHSTGNAPESSNVLKNIGAIFPPKQNPPSFLLGMHGISSPICQSTELVADFRDEPVPTTSPTKTNGLPFFFKSSIVSSGLSIPSLVILYIANACNGISGLDQASVAGDKSSVLISPGTL